jgi:hypothetical protein
MAARSHLHGVIGAHRPCANNATPNAIATSAPFTHPTACQPVRVFMANGTFYQAIVAVWVAVSCVDLVVPSPNAATAAGAGGQTIVAEALSAGGANTGVGAVLLTARTANRTARADQLLLTACLCHAVGAQMALALAYTTCLTLDLAGVTDRIATARADADMCVTSTFAARPAHLPTGRAVLGATDRA